MLHARGKLVVVLAEGADVPVEHDVDVARLWWPSPLVARVALSSWRRSLKPSVTICARASIFPLYVLVFHRESLGWGGCRGPSLPAGTGSGPIQD